VPDATTSTSPTPANGANLDRLLAQGVVTVQDLAELFHVYPATIRDWVKARKLPPPLPCSTKRHRWDVRQVAVWAGLSGGPAHAV
jgi:hypothetical protein